MIGGDDRYVMLVASLPAIGLLSEKEPPINSDRLAQRLKMLSPEDHAELTEMGHILAWSRIDTAEDDARFVAQAEAVIGRVRSPTLRDALRDRLEIRTLIAALRRRHGGEEAPAGGTRWGFGRYVEQIRANWGQPDFGVGRIFPWILPAKEKLERGDVAGLERIVLDAAWAAGTRYELGHAFDFEAVALYLVRWSLAERWSRYDAVAASARFEELLHQALEHPARAEAAA